VFVSVNVSAMVSRLDDSVGQIVGALTETGMLRNSIIVFVSDNGAPSIGDTRNWGSNYPLRGVRVFYILHRSDHGASQPVSLKDNKRYMVSSIFRSIILCRPLKINIHFGGKCRFCLQG
jgi:arylsulfatase A-like enzyme